MKKTHRISDVGTKNAQFFTKNDLVQARNSEPSHLQFLYFRRLEPPVHHFFLRSPSFAGLSKSWLENVHTIAIRLGGVCVVFAAFMTLVPTTGIAAIIAQDNASNYTASSAFTSVNGGNGFGNWSRSVSGGANVIATGPVFEISASSGTANLYSVDRPFDAALNIGDTLSLLVVSASNPGSSFNSVNLYVDGTERGDLYYASGATTWGWNDGSGGVDTRIATSATNVLFSFTRTGSTSYSVTFGSFSHTGNITSGSSSSSSAVSMVDFSVVDGGTMQFNNLQIQSVPEPSTYAMLVAGGFVAAGAAVRRRRRQDASAL